MLRSIWEDGKLELVEQFKVLFLNRANKVIALFNVSTGGITGTVADPRLILSAALKINAVSKILCHNHPSGSLKPSANNILQMAAAFIKTSVLKKSTTQKKARYKNNRPTIAYEKTRLLEIVY